MNGMFRIYCNGEEIGSSSLEERDRSMGTARGRFLPTAGYAGVQHVFRLFADAQREAHPPRRDPLLRYYRERAALDLRVTGPDGVAVPASVVHIEDFSHESDDVPYQIEVHVEDVTFFHGE
jgi:hypothetical protein